MGKLSAGQLTNLRRFNSGYHKAVETVRQEPGDAHNWFHLALNANLLGWADKANAAHLKASLCDNFTPLLDGNFHRDHALRAIRYGILPLAEYHLAQVMRLHVKKFFLTADLQPLEEESLMQSLLAVNGLGQYGDETDAYANCTAAWMDAMGRRLSAAGDAGAAMVFHSLADDWWMMLDEKANAQWQYNNLIHWLKAVVQISPEMWEEGVPGFKSRDNPAEVIEMLVDRIVRDCPEGSKSRSDEAALIMVWRIGPQLHDAAMRLRAWSRHLGL